MATAPIPIDPAPAVPDSSLPEPTFDSQYEAFNTWEKTKLAPQASALAQNVYENTQATEAAKGDAEQAVTDATAQADAAMGYRNTAGNYASTATTQAGLAGDERAAAVFAREGAQDAREGAEEARDDAAAILTDVQTFGGELLVATSTTSLTPGAGNKSFAIQPNKGYDVGMYLIATSAAAPGSRMAGTVVSYNRATGALVLAVDAFAGSGARADWVLGVGARDGSNGMTTQVVTANTACVPNVRYIVAAAGIVLTLPTSWAAGDTIAFSESIGAGEYTLDFGTTPLRGASIGLATIQAGRGGAAWIYQDTTRGLI